MHCNVLTAHHLVERLWWCQEHIRWRRAQWGTVLFSDESRFKFTADGRSKIYQRHNERYAANCFLEHDNFGGGSVMVWAGIHHDGCTVFGALNAQIYRNEILQHHIVPVINAIGIMLQYDNARLHTARVCRDFLKKKRGHPGSQSSSK